jgi:LmbE family N-acetylglucosaminyl deacetylase
MAMEVGLRILAIGSHIDDIELGCGGAISRARRSGHDVKMVVMTPSDYTDYSGNILRTREEAFQEGEAAARVLGVNDFVVLDFPTKDVPYHSSAIEALNKIIDDYRPDIFFTHWPFDTHQAHRATALSTISAARRYNSLLMYEPLPPSGRSYIGFRPQVYVDISLDVDIKEKSLREHRTQLEKYEEQWLEAVRARSRHRGFEMGVEHAETFEVLRMELTL